MAAGLGCRQGRRRRQAGLRRVVVGSDRLGAGGKEVGRLAAGLQVGYY